MASNESTPKTSRSKIKSADEAGSDSSSGRRIKKLLGRRKMSGANIRSHKKLYATKSDSETSTKQEKRPSLATPTTVAQVSYFVG